MFVRIFQQIVKDNEKKIVQLHSDMLGRGKDSKEKAIKPLYSNPYKKVKKKKGSSPYGKIINRVTLFLSGEFHRSFKIFLKPNQIILEPDQTNADLGGVLINRYGDDIEGLTEKDEDMFAKRHEKGFESRVQKQLDIDLNKALNGL